MRAAKRRRRRTRIEKRRSALGTHTTLLMIDCCHREGIEQQFGERTARRELRRLRRRGPTKTTRLLVDALRAQGVDGASLIDVGGGVGAVHHALLDAGAREAVQVDVAPAYLAAAREEAERRGHHGRVRFVHGDVVERAGELPDADVVTLDRVICCYPDMPALVASSAGKARRLYGAVYPRDTWWMRRGLTLVNALLRLRRSAFRAYLHPPPAIEAALRECGFERAYATRTLVWHVAVYARRTG
jgi:SAM-dependent methyltransferase